MPTPRPASRVVRVTTLVLLLVALAACSGGEPASTAPSPSIPPVEVPPALTATWTSPAGTFRNVAAHDDRMAVETEGPNALTGRDLTTGEERWRFEPSGGLRRICHVSPEVSPDGLVGLLLARPGQRCTVAAALDVATGDLRWTRVIPGEPPYHEGRGVDVGDTTLLAELNCSQVVRLDLADGAPLGVLAPQDRKCANESATDGEVVAVLADPETAETPDDFGTGFIPVTDVPGAIELYDADSGRRLWRRPLATTRGTGVQDVVSSDPLVLTTTDRGRTTTRLWSDRGRPGAYVGPTLPAFGAEEPLLVLGELDGVLVVRLVGSGVDGIAGYDTATGAELWAVPLPESSGRTAAALTSRGLVLARPTTVEGRQQLWLTRHDVRDPSEAVTLGRVPGSSATFVGDRVQVLDRPPSGGGQELSSYTLDGAGEERTYPVPPTDGEAGLADGELTQAEAFRACGAVSRETLLTAGLDWGGLPDPVDCRWTSDASVELVRRELVVEVSVLPAVTDLDGQTTSATETARAAAEEQATDDALDPGLRLLEVDEAAGLGERTWTRLAQDDFETRARTVTQWGNVVVEATASQDLVLETGLPDSTPLGDLSTATYAAVADVLAGLGAPAQAADLPDPGPDGPTTRVPRACRVLAADAARLVPGTTGAGDRQPTASQESRRRRSTCAWVGDDARLVVEVYAVPGSPDGRSAQEWAREIGGLTSYRDLRREPSLPGSSRLYRYASDDGDYRSTQAVSVVGDLLVSVELTDSDSAPPAEEFEAEVVGLVRGLQRASR